MQVKKFFMVQTVFFAVLALYLFSCSISSQAQTGYLPFIASEGMNRPVALDERHPDAGIWVSYIGDNRAEDLKAPYIKGAMAWASWQALFLGEQTFNWDSLERDLNIIVNGADKKAFITVASGYCPQLDWPDHVKQRIATRKAINRRGCPPLQFWDPEYLKLQKTYIRALADFLAEFDANDRNPRQTDVLFVRAQVMAETMENLPTDYENWEWQDFRPAPNGRIYQVNLTEQIAYSYQREIAMTYKRELERAYRARGLALAPTPAIKGSGYWEPGPNRDFFVQEGLWLDHHNGSPNPLGWYYDFVRKARAGKARATMESDAHWPAEYLGQFTYWEVLSALHSGLEFISIYGNNRKVPNLQPKGPVNFAENREAMQLAEKYAGALREPDNAPGAWIALRGNYPQDRWGEPIQHVRIWTNLSQLITQYRPQDSVLLVGVDATDGAFQEVIPRVRRVDEGPWPNEIQDCQQDYPAYECEFLHQAPQRYLGQVNGRHTYTYRQSNLGTVLYCGKDMFCQQRDQATRSEPMLWARRTNGAAGAPHMRFDINDQFAKSLGNRAVIRVAYLDQGNDTWALQYDSRSGPNNQTEVIQKTNSNLWKEVFFELNDVQFNGRQEGGTDLSLFSMNDGDDIFHIVEILRDGPIVEVQNPQEEQGTLPNAPAPAPTSAPAATAAPAPVAQPVSGVNVFKEQNGEVIIEAENYSALEAGKNRANEHRWTQWKQTAGFSGAGAMQALPDQDITINGRSNTPLMKYQIEFEHTGRYQVAVRGLGINSQSNSIHVGFNKRRVTDSRGISWPLDDNELTWRSSYIRDDNGQLAPTVVDVTEKGIQTLSIWMREDGTVIDKIWLARIGATDTPSTPEEQPAPEGNPEANPNPRETPAPEEPDSDPIIPPVEDGSPDVGPGESPTGQAPLTRIQLPIVSGS